MENPIENTLKLSAEEYSNKINDCQNKIKEIDTQMKDIIDSIKYNIFLDLKDADMKKRSIYIQNGLKIIEDLENDFNDIDKYTNNINNKLDSIEEKVQKLLEKQLS